MVKKDMRDLEFTDTQIDGGGLRIVTTFDYNKQADAVTAVLGDLSALHDLNSLALLAGSDPPVILIVVNNEGGGIFHFLPVAHETQHFEQYFGTPHGWNFAAAARMFELPYSAPQTIESFCSSYDQAVAGRRSCVLEITTRRSQTLELHRSIERRIKGVGA